MEGQRAKDVGFAVLREFAEVGGSLGEMEEAIPALTAYADQFADPEFACSLHGIPPNPTLTFPGVAGIEKAIRDWSATFTSLVGTLDDAIEFESALVLLVTQTGITRHGGVEVTQPSAMVFKLRDGRLIRLELHLDRNEALRSAQS